VLVNGNLWAVQGVQVNGTPNLAQIVLYRIDPVGNAVLSQTVIPTPSGLFVYYPAIAVNPAGDIVVGFSGSNSSTPASAYAITGRFNGSTVSWGTAVQTQVGANATYSFVDGNGRNRWGDYSAVTLDPADPGIFWASQEYLAGTNNWAIKNTELIPSRSGEIRWATAVTGTFTDTSKWIGGVLPGATDHAIFSRWSNSANPAITMPSGTTALDRLSVRQSGPGVQVSFNLAANNATLNLTDASSATPSLAVAEFQGTATAVFSGNLLSTLSTRYTTIAGQAGAVGTLTISGGNWNNQNDVFVGGTATAAGGTGTLNVFSAGVATVTGTLTIWNTTSAVKLGDVNGPGTLTVGALTNPAGTTPTVTILAPVGSASQLQVNGAGSPLFTGTVVIGNNGKLNGTGTLGGPVQMNGTGTLQGGTGGGTAADKLTLGSFQINNAGTILTTFAGTHTAPTASLIELGSGALSHTAGMTTIRLAVSGAFDAGQSYTIPVIHFGTALGLTIQNPPPGSEFSISMNPIGFAFSGTPTLSYDSTSTPHTLLVTFVPAPVPEPGAVLAVAGLVLAGWGARTRLPRSIRRG
jgi:hypothetical protein